MVEVVVYSKPNCCLCDELKQQLWCLGTEHRFDLREVNILEDEQVFERFKDQIPVVFINGRKAFKYRLDEKEFLQCLARES